MTIPAHQPEFIAALMNNTVSALQAAQGNSDALDAAVKQFLTDATAANIEPDEIENILGINEPSILDLAELSEDDEETVIDIFEQLVSSQ